MDVCMYSIKAENQAVNIWVYVITTHKEQGCKDAQLGASNIYGKFSRRPRIRDDRALLGLHVHLREYT